jgi:hypothetical protein
VQNILNVEQVVNDNDESITITPEESFQPLGLFHDVHSQKYTFQLYFLLIPNHHLDVLMKKIYK